MTKSSVFAMLIAVTAALPAHAGSKGGIALVVNKAGRFAYGSMGTVRNEADTGAGIGCTVYASKGSPATVFCGAETTATGYTWGGCTSTDPALVQVALAMTSDAEISFDWDASGNCTYLSIDVSSSADPK
jgi:hypothetical protein